MTSWPWVPEPLKLQLTRLDREGKRKEVSAGDCWVWKPRSKTGPGFLESRTKTRLRDSWTGAVAGPGPGDEREGKGRGGSPHRTGQDGARPAALQRDSRLGLPWTGWPEWWPEGEEVFPGPSPPLPVLTRRIPGNTGPCLPRCAPGPLQPAVVTPGPSPSMLLGCRVTPELGCEGWS